MVRPLLARHWIPEPVHAMIETMPFLTAPDGIRLSYHVLGDGPQVVCIPGGPMRASVYLGDLGGLPAHARLIIPDLRGTGSSAAPADMTTYRCDRQTEDIEALRVHLGLDQVNLLGHSAGANLAVRYAERYPDRIRRLLLVTPSTFAVGLMATFAQRREVVSQRRDEPWFGEVDAALERINTGQERDGDWEALAPTYYGRWDDAARAHDAADAAQRNAEAGRAFGADGAFDPETTKAALAKLGAPVLILAGQFDVAAPPVVLAEYAALFPDCELVIQPVAGHYPWLDDPALFTSAIAAFLAR
jgi:proline iminopeptidase